MFAFLSSSILLILYFVVFILSSTLLYLSGLEGGFALSISMLITIGFIILQFFLSPFIYDLMLRFMYRCNFVTVDELPSYLSEYIKKLFSERNVKFPRIGIIEDMTPTAFTYGNFPSNARIVISRGLLEIMDEEEAKAVIAHECGHIFHYDFVFMTLAAMIPVILYYVYRIAMHFVRSSSSRRNGGAIVILAIVTYIIYIISEYVILYLSRLREYYADSFAAYSTMNPNALATALVKVGYGLLNFGAKSSEQEDGGNQFYRSPFRVLGLMDYKQAKNVSLAVLNSNVAAIEAVVENVGNRVIDAIGKVMLWDLFNPWASILELSSTHPLIAKRIRNLSRIAKELGLPFSIQVPTYLPKEDDGSVDIVPGSLWDEFLIDLFFQYAPLNFTLIAFVGGILFSAFLSSPTATVGFMLMGFSVGSVMKWIFTYKGSFKECKIFDLLSKTKVSMVRSVPAIIRGKIVGRGVAGYILSEDVLLQDDTGFIYVDYRTGISWGDLAYGYFITSGLIGKDAVMKGYFRRALFPYFEVIEIVTEDGKTHRSYFRYLWLGLSILAFFIGMFIIFIGIVGI